MTLTLIGKSEGMKEWPSRPTRNKIVGRYFFLCDEKEKMKAILLITVKRLTHSGYNLRACKKWGIKWIYSWFVGNVPPSSRWFAPNRVNSMNSERASAKKTYFYDRKRSFCFQFSSEFSICNKVTTYTYVYEMKDYFYVEII